MHVRRNYAKHVVLFWCPLAVASYSKTVLFKNCRGEHSVVTLIKGKWSRLTQRTVHTHPPNGWLYSSSSGTGTLIRSLQRNYYWQEIDKHTNTHNGFLINGNEYERQRKPTCVLSAEAFQCCFSVTPIHGVKYYNEELCWRLNRLFYFDSSDVKLSSVEGAANGKAPISGTHT